MTQSPRRFSPRAPHPPRNERSFRLTALLAAMVLALGTGCDEDPKNEGDPPGEPSPSFPGTVPDDACAGGTALDVMPGTWPNLLPRGTVEVAVLGTDTLDAATVDAATARLTEFGEGPEPRTLTAEPTLASRDVDGDGREDGVLRFDVTALDDPPRLGSRLKLTAKTRAGLDVLACDRVHSRHEFLASLPVPTGPHAVGTVSWFWKDTARPEVFTPEPDDVRELSVRAWYPAEARPQVEPAPAFLTWRQGAAFAVYQGLTPTAFDRVASHAVEGAPLAASPARHPVLLFSPGLGVAPELYTSLLEDLASHGYVVVALSHTFSTGPVVFPSGFISGQTQEPSLFDAGKTRRLFDVWTEDARFVLSQVVALDSSDAQGRFTGRLDLERMGMLGHSFGGATAAALCQREARMKACANLDGTFQGDFAQGVDAPFLLMLADHAPDSTQTTFARAMRGGGYVARMAGAEHLTYSDSPVLLPLFTRYGTVSGGLPDVGTVGPRGVDIARAYVRAFFDKHVRGLPAPLLDGPAANYPEVTLTVEAR